MTIEENSNTYRGTARVVGLLYIAGMVIGIGGNILIQSILGAPNRLAAASGKSMVLAIGALLWLLTVAGDAAHGILMFPVLRRQSERLAIGYLGSRIIDAVFIGVHVLFLLFQIPLGLEYLKAGISDARYLQTLSALFMQADQYAYQIGMSFVGLAGLVLGYAFYRSRLVPRFVAVWGLVGYIFLLCGSLLEILGFDLRLIHTIPGGLWELFMGLWLIVKGFKLFPIEGDLR
jgi:hypothetical protein